MSAIELETEFEKMLQQNKLDLSFLSLNISMVKKQLYLKTKQNEIHFDFILELCTKYKDSQTLAIVLMVLDNVSLDVKIQGIKLAQILCESNRIRNDSRIIQFKGIIESKIFNYLFYRELELLEATLTYLNNIDILKVLDLILQQFVYTMDAPVKQMFTTLIAKRVKELGIYIYKYLDTLVMLSLDMISTLHGLELLTEVVNFGNARIERYYSKILVALAELHLMRLDTSDLIGGKSIDMSIDKPSTRNAGDLEKQKKLRKALLLRIQQCPNRQVQNDLKALENLPEFHNHLFISCK